jgi:hypothetical protein
LFAVVSCLLAWQVYTGPEKAPAVKRAQDQPVDLKYLHDVAIPSADPTVQPKSFTFCVTSASAQDPAVVNAKTIKVRFENDRVRVLEATLPPGVKEQVHILRT